MNRDELIGIRLELLRREIGKSELVAVSKYSEVDDILHAYRAGQRAFGENRLDSLMEKAEALEKLGINDIVWHFIGNIQSNKINRLYKVKNLLYIHSVDSIKTLKSLTDRIEQFEGNRLRFFFQVNTSGEDEKAGFRDYDTLAGAVNLYFDEAKPTPLRLEGLMTMGGIRSEDQMKDARNCFQKLKEYKEKLQSDFDVKDLKLSMGMTSDYPIAVEEGADFLRIGSKIFQEKA